MNATEVIAGRAPWSVDCGCALHLLDALPPGRVHCAMTSPPYFGLRQYGAVAGRTVEDLATDWPAVSFAPMPGLAAMEIPAQRCCLGNESDVHAYVAHLLLIFRGVGRALHPSGLLWCNLGDSYLGSGGGGGEVKSTLQGRKHSAVNGGRRQSKTAAGLSAKNLLAVPWRFALAMQADGWILRSVVKWQKLAPMPCSATDRPTCATEEVFLFARRPSYYYDQDAERVGVASATVARDRYTRIVDDHADEQYSARHDHETLANPQGRNLWDYWGAFACEEIDEAGGAWTIAPDGGKKEKHVASFPRELPRRCISLSTSAHGVCPACAAPWGRRTRKSGKTSQEAAAESGVLESGRLFPGSPQNIAFAGAHKDLANRTVEHLGWTPSCSCGREPIPAVVLDPFCGSGTTGLVARLMGRRFVGLEISPRYADMGRRRIESACPLDDAVARAAAASAGQPSLFPEAEGA